MFVLYGSLGAHEIGVCISAENESIKRCGGDGRGVDGSPIPQRIRTQIQEFMVWGLGSPLRCGGGGH